MDMDKLFDLLAEASDTVKAARDMLADENGIPLKGKIRKWRKLDKISGDLNNVIESIQWHGDYSHWES